VALLVVAGFQFVRATATANGELQTATAKSKRQKAESKSISKPAPNAVVCVCVPPPSPGGYIGPRPLRHTPLSSLFFFFASAAAAAGASSYLAMPPPAPPPPPPPPVGRVFRLLLLFITSIGSGSGSESGCVCVCGCANGRCPIARRPGAAVVGVSSSAVAVGVYFFLSFFLFRSFSFPSVLANLLAWGIFVYLLYYFCPDSPICNLPIISQSKRSRDGRARRDLAKVCFSSSV